MSEVIKRFSSLWRDTAVQWRSTAGRRRPMRLAAVSLSISLAGWAYGVLAIWAFLAILRGVLGRPGLAAGALVAHVMGAGPRGAITGFAAAMGAPVHWQVPLLHIGGWMSPAALVSAKPWLAAVVVVPLLAGALMGWLAARAAVKYGVGARFLLATSVAGFALVGAGAVALSGHGSSGRLLALAASLGWTVLLSIVWAVIGGALGLALRRALARRHRLGGVAVYRRVARAAAAATLVLVLGSPVLAAGAAEAAACAGNPNACSAGNDGFIAAISNGGAGLVPSGPGASVVLNSGYHFQSYLNYVSEFWMSHETNVYWNDNSRMIWLLQHNTALANQAAATLQLWEPAFAAVGTVNASNVVITQAMADQANSLAQAFENADMTAGNGGALAQSIQTEEAKIVPDQLVGLNVNQAVQYLNLHITS